MQHGNGHGLTRAYLQVGLPATTSPSLLNSTWSNPTRESAWMGEAL